MPAHHLPRNPSLEQLRKRAKEIRDLVRTGQTKFTQLARELHPRWKDASDAPTAWARFTLADAQLVIARSNGLTASPAGARYANTSTWSPGTAGPRNAARPALRTSSTSSCGWPA